jgi:predicted ATPase with chaperone activity
MQVISYFEVENEVPVTVKTFTLDSADDPIIHAAASVKKGARVILFLAQDMDICIQATDDLRRCSTTEIEAEILKACHRCVDQKRQAEKLNDDSSKSEDSAEVDVKVFAHRYH